MKLIFSIFGLQIFANEISWKKHLRENISRKCVISNVCRCEINEIKTEWTRVIGDDTGGHGINIFIRLDFSKDLKSYRVRQS